MNMVLNSFAALNTVAFLVFELQNNQIKGMAKETENILKQQFQGKVFFL